MSDENGPIIQGGNPDNTLVQQIRLPAKTIRNEPDLQLTELLKENTKLRADNTRHLEQIARLEGELEQSHADAAVLRQAFIQATTDIRLIYDDMRTHTLQSGSSDNKGFISAPSIEELCKKPEERKWHSTLQSGEKKEGSK